MEIRTITQVRIYKLVLNHMGDRCEGASIVAISGDYDNLVGWYEAQKLPTPFRDEEGWYRTFAEGSPLHWYNPADPLVLNCTDCWNHGISDEWVNEDVWDEICRSGRFLIID